MVLIGSIGGVMRFVSYLLDGDAALGLGLVDDDGITVRPVRLRGSERPVTDLVTLTDDWPAIRNELVAAADRPPSGPSGGPCPAIRRLGLAGPVRHLPVNVRLPNLRHPSEPPSPESPNHARQ
ncbi:MAG: hypothetical protein JWP48_1491 [Actinoallomurus sp.]|nr:hypothetical protein [Actinoallomurus sp.]